MARLRSSEGAIVVPLVLAVLKKKRLKKQLRGRGHQVKSRRAKRYMKHFDEIWDLQSVLLSESNRYEIPIIQNLSQEDTIRQIMDTIVDRLSAEFSDTVEACAKGSEGE
jgi:2-phosphoglycerate kinase